MIKVICDFCDEIINNDFYVIPNENPIKGYTIKKFEGFTMGYDAVAYVAYEKISCKTCLKDKWATDISNHIWDKK